MGSCQQQLPLSDVVATSGKRTDRATSGARCRKPQQQSPLLSPLCNISICCFRSIFQKRRTRCLFMEHRKRSQAKWIPPGKANQFSPFSCFTTNPAWISDKLQSLTDKENAPTPVSEWVSRFQILEIAIASTELVNSGIQYPVKQSQTGFGTSFKTSLHRRTTSWR